MLDRKLVSFWPDALFSLQVYKSKGPRNLKEKTMYQVRKKRSDLKEIKIKVKKHITCQNLESHSDAP